MRPHLFVLPLSEQGGLHGERVLQQYSEGVGAFDYLDGVVIYVAQVAAEFDVNPVLVEASLESLQIPSSGLVAR
jgi:hypothetical protein